MTKPSVLFVCRHNTGRSQMAEAYLRSFLGDTVTVASAGTIAADVPDPGVVAVMAEDGIDISKHTSNNVDEYVDIPFDYVITVCDNAKENCPYFPTTAERFHYNFPDPAKATGTPDEVMAEFRRVRDMIKAYSAEFVQTHIA